MTTNGDSNKPVLLPMTTPRHATSLLAACALAVAACVCGCKELRFDTTFNALYYDQCASMQEASLGEHDNNRLITAYTALLYMDAEVAGKAGEAFRYSKEVRMTTLPGVDKSTAAKALSKIIGIYGSARQWDELLGVMEKHIAYLGVRGDVLLAGTNWLDRMAELPTYRERVAAIAKQLIADTEHSPYRDVLEARAKVHPVLVRLAAM